jgi:hypothetical protein
MDTYGTWAACWAAIPPVKPNGNLGKQRLLQHTLDFTIKNTYNGYIMMLVGGFNYSCCENWHDDPN